MAGHARRLPRSGRRAARSIPQAAEGAPPMNVAPSFRTFATVWAGQFVSSVGSMMTSFALGFWAYRHFGSATKFATILLFGALPGILLMPFLGAIADRYERRLLMMASDALGLLAVATLAVAASNDRLSLPLTRTSVT